MSDDSHYTHTPPDPAVLAPLYPGYDIQGLIASGGMGSVYQAEQRSLERMVAIKILSEEFSKDKAFRAIFEAEAKAMAKLNHPNLIGVYDFGEVAGMLYIIMEYVPGQSLYHSANGIALDASEVVRLVSGICHGLAHAHENGIIHRDIKPSNILLDLEARPKIGDFGLARKSDQTVQEGEEIFGTPHYTAPEVVHTPQSVDHRADIFSVGVLLHELLTGRLPADDPRPPSAISQCDPRFDAIVRRATDPQPERRYPNAAAIAVELESISTTPGTKVLRTTLPRRTPTPVRRSVRPVRPAPGNSSKFGLIVLLIIGICFAGLLYQYLHRANEANSNTRVAPEVITVKEPETALPEPLEEITPTPKPGPDVERNDSSGIVALPEPEPVAVEPVKEPEAKFDVADFLENKARKIMRERSATIIAANKTELGKNLSAYERELQAEARRQGRAILRDSYSESIKTFVEECRKDGNMIPEDIPEEIENLEVASSKHAEYVEAQEAISEKLKRDLSKLSDTYILGITKQIERLKDSGDPTAVKMLNEEIDTVHDDEDFFPNLMMGEE